jgi:membrane associated rhomboid family serine protease
MNHNDRLREPKRSEPILFAPFPLVVLIGFMLGLHAYRVIITGLFEDADLRLLDLTAFVPARFAIWLGLTDVQAVLADVAGSSAATRGLRLALFQAFVVEGETKPWTIVSYSLLHAGWEHVIFNALWMLAFGSPVMHRFGVMRFLLFFAVTAAAAAAFHALFNAADVAVLVGASGAVSGLTAAALRFAIGSTGFGGQNTGWLAPAAPLLQALQNRNVMMFIIVWFGINLLTGLGVPMGAGADVRIAWEAHVGGFLAGLLLFSAFDPIRLQNHGLRQT